MRHRGRAFLLPGAKRFFHLPNFGPLEVADLQRALLHRRAHRRARVQELRVPITGEHLGGRDGCEPKRRADVNLDARIDVGVRAHCARQLADRDARARPAQALHVPAHLHRPEGKLDAEGGRFGVNPMCAPDHGGVSVHVSLLGQRLFEFDGRLDQQVGSTSELQSKRGVHHVARREPVVHPCAFGLSDPFLHDVDECGNVVFGDQLPLVDRSDVESGPSAHRFGGCRRYDSDLRPRFGGQDLHLEPRTKLRLVGEQCGHLGQ